MRRVKALAGSVAALVGGTGAFGLAAGPASAAAATMLCTGSGAVQLSSGPEGGVGWSLDLSGVSCVAGSETLGGSAEGTGTSQSLGLCPSPPPGPDRSLTVEGLRVDVVEHLSGALGSTSVPEVWGASETLFPGTTPFEVTRNGAVVGLGTIFTHLFAHCPPAGTPSAYVVWIEQLPA